MSFLAPFYLLATLGVAAPIVLHLIRRQPKGEVEFSSLMFLEPTPPRLTRRSRLENLPLLLLRCLVIAALALAFARPFLPSTQTTATQEAKPAVILLVDRSASMRREGLWDQAIRNAKSVIDKESSSLISVVAFDREPALELSLENAGELSADSRQSVALQTIEELEPTWLDTNLGAAIRFAADHAARFTLQDEAGSGSLKTRIVLISDLQSGAEIDSLQGYEWPDGVWLELQSVRPQVFGNLSLRVLRQSNTENREEFDRDQPKLKVRVKHASDGQASIATLRIDEDVASNSIQLDAGTSKVTLLNLPETVSSDRKARVQLSGDQDDFDNKFYFIRPVKAEQRILFVGTATERQDTRESLALFAEQIPWSDATRRVSFETSETVDIETSTN
ncbi:MAG: BatA domain-containing protein, partial [Planctomycetota bacterium]